MTEHLAAYLRDSGGDDQDMSLDQQEAEIRRWAQQNGYIITRFFRDEARPGSSVTGRDAFSRMIDYFRQPGASETGIVIWKYSRFSRDIDDAQFYKADLRRRGYKIVSIKDNIPDGAEGRFFEASIDWMNQRFLDDLSTDVKRGLHHIVDSYGAVPGTPPFGFMRQPIDMGKRRDGSTHHLHRWVPNPETAPIVRKIFELRAQGKSYSNILDEIPKVVAKNSLSTLFSNQLYIGTLVYGDKEYPNYCEPIVDQSTWDQVQKLRREHTLHQHLSSDAGTMQIRRRTSTHLLSGLIYCSKCGSPMYSQTSKQKNGTYYSSYACNRAKRRRDCDAKNIPEKVLDKAILANLQEYIMQPDHILEIQKIALESQHKLITEYQNQRHILKTQKKRLRTQITRITAAIAEMGHSRSLIEKLKQLELEENQLSSQIELIGNPEPIVPMSYEEIKQMASQTTELLQSAPIQVAQELIRDLIVRINIERDGTKIIGEIVYIAPKKKSHLKTKTVSTGDASVGAPLYTHSFTTYVRKKAR